MKILKLGMLLAIACTFITAKAPPSPKDSLGGGCLEADILFVTDWSGSVRGFESNITNAFGTFINDFTLSERGVKIGILNFSDYPILYSGLTSDVSLLYGVLDTLSKTYATGDTYIDPPLRSCESIFYKSTKERSALQQPQVAQFLILMSDGDSSNEYDQLQAEKTAEKLKSEGIIIIAIGIGNMNENDRNAMKKMSSGSDYYFESDFLSIEKSLQDLGARMCM